MYNISPYCRCIKAAGYYIPSLLPKIDETARGFKILERYNYKKDENVFSTSIYGNNPKYYKNIDNLIYNANQLENWNLRVYLHDQVNDDIKNKLINKKAQVFIVRDPLVIPGLSAGAFWRFMPLKENIQFIVIDSDDKLELKKIKKYLKKWDDSGKQYIRENNIFTVMWPKSHIMAKNWGAKNANLKHLNIENYKLRTPYSADEIFLSYELYPKIKNNICETFEWNEFKNLNS